MHLLFDKLEKITFYKGVGLCNLLKAFGFDERIRGDHHIFSKNEIDEILNLQPIGSKSKAYQVKQVRNIILKYKFNLGVDDE